MFQRRGEGLDNDGIVEQRRDGDSRTVAGESWSDQRSGLRQHFGVGCSAGRTRLEWVVSDCSLWRDYLVTKGISVSPRVSVIRS